MSDTSIPNEGDWLIDGTIYNFTMVPHEALQIIKYDGPEAFVVYYLIARGLPVTPETSYLSQENIDSAYAKLIAHNVISQEVTE